MAKRTIPLLQTELPGVELVSRGKVRDVFKIDESRLLFVASDRISAFDVVMPNGIPDKGRVLTQISLFWFHYLQDAVRFASVRNHLISANVDVYPQQLKPFRDQLIGRSMLVQKVEIVPIECIVRGYLAGSGWKEYQKSQTICGIPLPAGLRESDKLPEPIFTPSTKEADGHDININPAEMRKLVSDRLARLLTESSLEIYKAASEYALTRGIIIADTKFEFGLDTAGGNLVLADEVLTPDSSRFWDVENYQPGRAQDSYDKQYVRDYLETLDWNKEPPAPELPEEVVLRTREKYLQAYTRLTGKTLV